MSRVNPAEKRRHLVLVIRPLPRQRNEGQSVSSRAREGSVCTSIPTTTPQPRVSSGSSPHPTLRPPPPATTLPPSDTDPHNEVERRRKQKIARNIKTLAETLKPPCHCGKATRAEVLEMVVQQIRELQHENSELQSKLKELPRPPSGEELRHQALVLIEENLRLRALLLASVNCDRSQGHCSEEPRPPVQQAECGEEVVRLLADREVDEEMGELERRVSLSAASSSSSGSEGQQRGHSDTCERGEGRSEPSDDGEMVDEATTVCKQMVDETKGVAADQPWPISSLLSDSSRTGSRDHATFNLPILSPTYIAEHCSVAVCEQQFFPPPVSSPPSTGDALETVRSDASCSLAPFHIAATTTLNTVSTDSVPSTASDGSISSVATLPPHTIASCTSSASDSSVVALPPHTTVSCTSSGSVVMLPPHTTVSCTSSASDGSVSSVATLPLHTTAASTSSASDGSSTSLPPNTTTACSSSAPAGSHARRHPRSRSTPSYHTPPLTRRSIVQPWVGHNSTGSRKTENVAVRGGRSTQQNFCSTPQAMGVEMGTPPPPGNHHVSVCDCNQQNRASTLHYTNHRYYPHSAQSRTVVPNSRHTCGSRYPNTCQHCNAAAVSATGIFSHSDLSQERTQCSERPSSYQSTGSSFPLHTTGPPHMMFQPSGFPADPYFNHTIHSSSQNPLAHHHPHSSHTPPLLDHHHVVHQHNYNLPPPHPHHPTPTPSFTSHPRHPQHTSHSHHNTVWRPYSERQRTATRFNLSDILSPSPATSPTLVLPTHAQQSPSGRVPSFFVDHLLDDL